MSEQEIKEIVWKVANDSAIHGPGWAQEGVVLRTIREQIANGAAGSICRSGRRSSTRGTTCSCRRNSPGATI
jgi:hypothetical protein